MDKDSIESFGRDLALGVSVFGMLAGMIAASFAESKYVMVGIIAISTFVLTFIGGYEGRRFYERHRQD
ncbi:hypothetical protein [Dialister succinatiphilus]|uniref:hypothetical protein n=1 Tax=Dialister succinatiphilus TaxID=487173 RepID=UPI003F7D748D